MPRGTPASAPPKKERSVENVQAMSLSGGGNNKKKVLPEDSALLSDVARPKKVKSSDAEGVAASSSSMGIHLKTMRNTMMGSSGAAVPIISVFKSQFRNCVFC